MALIKCNLCGYEAADGRTIHGHMNRMHYDEYKATGFDLEQLTEGYKRTKSNEYRKERMKEEMGTKETKKDTTTNPKPEHLRLLNKNNGAELRAYNEGYRYIDPDDEIVYTTKEVKEEGWI
ncbi:MAG: hypothetical protein E7222_04175 [Clostridiales bacterium]|nr:hypothetical protein [Clostridiales bacterium]